MTGKAVDHSFPPIRPVPTCTHAKVGEPKEERESPGSSYLPIEILWQIAREAPVDCWLAAIAGRGLMRRVVHHVLRERVVSCLSRFCPRDRLPDLFKTLQDAHGFVFGDIPFTILFRGRSTPNQMNIAVGHGRVEGTIDLLLRLGYVCEEARFTQDGCSSVWPFRRGEVSLTTSRLDKSVLQPAHRVFTACR